MPLSTTCNSAKPPSINFFHKSEVEEEKQTNSAKKSVISFRNVRTLLFPLLSFSFIFLIQYKTDETVPIANEMPRRKEMELQMEIERKRNVPITLSWENIEVSTASSKEGIGKLMFCKEEIPGKMIIKNVNGIARPGTLMAIMGASGAGKTTLLNVLNYRNRGNLKISGDVKLNGEVVKSRAGIATISGYVQQEDLFIGYLKVKEQLKFQVLK